MLDGAFAGEGSPARVLTDRGPVFRGAEVQGIFAQRGVRHALTRPAHPWTNGRIERVFRTFKETIFGRFWLVRSIAQLDRFCADFVLWHNRDRPHSSWGGRTPDEVWRGIADAPRGHLGRIDYFDGRLSWWRFG